MSVASRAILSNFFEEQGTQNYPQYLSGLSRALFPTTFLEIPVSRAQRFPREFFIKSSVFERNRVRLTNLVPRIFLAWKARRPWDRGWRLTGSISSLWPRQRRKSSPRPFASLRIHGNDDGKQQVSSAKQKLWTYCTLFGRFLCRHLTPNFESIFKTNNITVFFVIGKNVRRFLCFFCACCQEKGSQLNKKKMVLGQVRGNWKSIKEFFSFIVSLRISWDNFSTQVNLWVS